MSHTRQTCVIALGLTIMDRCPECDRIDHENERVPELMLGPRKPDPAPSVSHNGGKTWHRANESEHSVYSVGAGLAAASATAATGIARTIQRLKSKELASYVHTRGNEPPRSEPREIDASFFVSCIEDEGQRRNALLLGPYDTHEEALANVRRGNDLAYAADPRSHWYSFGTCSINEPTNREGVFGK